MQLFLITFFFFYFSLMCKFVSTSEYALWVQVSPEARRGSQGPWRWSYRPLWAFGFAGNRTLVFCKSSKYSQLVCHLSSLLLLQYVYVVYVHPPTDFMSSLDDLQYPLPCKHSYAYTCMSVHRHTHKGTKKTRRQKTQAFRGLWGHCWSKFFLSLYNCVLGKMNSRNERKPPPTGHSLSL